MKRFSIQDKCRVNTNKEADTFVGIKCEDGDISINFPLGYDVSYDDDKELHKDILLLFNTIRTTTGRRDSEIENGHKAYNETAFPIQAYMSVIYDFYARGYYKERERKHNVARRGKINWNRTIKTQKPCIQNGNAFYLDFIVNKNTINSDQMITHIHEYCVYESFSKIGWLFTSSMPERPKIKFNERLFRTVLKEKIGSTYNDKNKALFLSMLAIIDYRGSNCKNKNFKYGTYRFEYVWEDLIDRVYGILNKQDYFPVTYWKVAEKEYSNAPLEPDTIMIYNGNVYVLDAKYYKYGATKEVKDLPESTSINKQITYAEYIAEQEKYTKIHGEGFKVYNAFLMPFNSIGNNWRTNGNLLRIGEAYGEWKSNKKSYEKVQGILIDVKHLMKISTRQNLDEIISLANKIQQYVERENV
ncbi:LlaJI family restriction endonuclease [Eubacterium ventriosum]|uniref:LlaJI family restriction endonuclease n=1 Tax=Eubacterium ventriosum TaxID=39496 RepID=UPI003AB26FD0